MLHTGEQDTIAAIATPPGRGGIAILRVSGQDALQKVRELLEPCHHNLPDRKMLLCRIYDNGDFIDEALVCAMRAPHSYTGEDVVEIQCHGGSAAAGTILTALISHGVRPADPGEFTRRAFEHGRIDLVQAESVMEIVSSESREHLRHAELLMDGVFSKQMDSLIAHISQALSYLEASIDFVDQGITAAQHEHEIIHAIDYSIQTIDKMLSTHTTARRIRDGIRVVLAGPVNSGKSSLFNSLLGRKRAIVSDTPGTTRDWIEEKIELDGLPINLVDTAGLRKTVDAIEQEGVSEAERLMHDSDIILYLFVPGQTPLDENEGIPQVIPVFSKSDLAAPPPGYNGISISSLLGTGIDELRKELSRRCRDLVSSRSTDTLVLIERHRLGLLNARDALIRAQATIGKWSEEVAVFELDYARKEIETVLGRNIDLAVLETIFSKFCIGK